METHNMHAFCVLTLSLLTSFRYRLNFDVLWIFPGTLSSKSRSIHLIFCQHYSYTWIFLMLYHCLSADFLNILLVSFPKKVFTFVLRNKLTITQFSTVFKMLNWKVANYSQTSYANNQVLKKQSQNTLRTNTCAILRSNKMCYFPHAHHFHKNFRRFIHKIIQKREGEKEKSSRKLL